MRPTGLPRRAGLDGLRAAAVIGVLLYHQNLGWARGGFLGVDLFFVLSGFLITSILLDEQRRTGRVRLGAFWAARARRLLPAVAALLVVVLWIVPAFGLRWGPDVAGDARATAGYFANWWFIGSRQSYVDQSAGPSPFLHTWSLAIEEQWYLLIPLVLVGVRRWRRSEPLLVLLLGSATLASVLLAWRLHPSGSDPTRAYFGTDTHGQSLLVGALAAALVGRQVWAPAGRANKRLAWLAVPGAFALFALAAFATPDSDWLYRGGLLAVAVACVLIVVGVVATDPASGWLRHSLGSRPVVALGAISYGVYLWHWPTYVVVDHGRTGLSGPALFATRVGVTLLVATLSYHLIERPVRRQVWRRVVAFPVRPVAFGAAGVVGLALLLPVGSPSAPADSLQSLAHLAAQQRDRAVATSPAPAAPAHTAHVVALIGDSQALSLFAAARDAPGNGLSLRLATRLGCGVVPYVASAAGDVLRPPQPMCAEWAADRETEIADAQADSGVLFAGGWEQYDRYVNGRVVSFRDPRWTALTTQAYQQVLAEMARHERHLAVVLDSCHHAPDLALPVQTLYQWGRYPPVVNDTARIAAVNRAARAAAAAFPGVAVLDLGSFLCTAGYTNQLDGTRLRTDGVHWTTAGGRLVWRWLAPRLVDAWAH